MNMINPRLEIGFHREKRPKMGVGIMGIPNLCRRVTTPRQSQLPLQWDISLSGD